MPLLCHCGELGVLDPWQVIVELQDSRRGLSPSLQPLTRKALGARDSPARAASPGPLLVTVVLGPPKQAGGRAGTSRSSEDPGRVKFAGHSQ